MGGKKDDSIFSFFDDGSIAIVDDKLDELVDYINYKDIKNITINYWGYNQDNLKFLEKCPNIEKININNPNIKNLSALYNLENLKTLYVSELNGELELSKLKRLEDFIGECNKYLTGLDKCFNLKVLSLSKYKPKNINLEELAFLNELKYLQIIQTQITSLKGIGSLQKLTELQLYSAPKLEYIDEIDKVSENLKTLKFECCKKIKNHEYVTCLKELEVLAFSNCGEIPSINFIKEMPKLRQFIFVDTNVIDGDLSPCTGLEYSGFFDKKHYSHKFKELNDKKYWK